MNMTFDEAADLLRQDLSPERYIHTIGVVKTAKELSGIYGMDVEKAAMAALLHDCAKHMPHHERVSYCSDHGMEVSEAETDNLTLLHAKCGMIRAKEYYGIDDEDILHAIAVHTTGVPEMNLLDKIIFASDYLEPLRFEAPHLKELRILVLSDLDMTVYRILGDMLKYLSGTEKRLDPSTQAAHDYYKALINRRNELQEEE